MLTILRRILVKLKRDGIRLFIIRLMSKIMRVDSEFQLAKDKVWEILLAKYGYNVAYGPFKGMKLSQEVYWSKNDRITQTLGIYEEHVLEKLIQFSSLGSSTFIDIGAADGYFVVGTAYSKLFNKIVAYEIEEVGRKRIEQNAKINDCRDAIQILGEANKSSLREILSENSKATLLIDIEGAEYGFLDDKMLSYLSGNYIICEMHPWFYKDGLARQKQLIKSAEKYFNVDFIRRKNYRDEFEELFNLSDEERLVALSEGRPNNMQWMVLIPK